MQHTRRILSIGLMVICLALFYSCAKIPSQSIDLMTQIEKEGERMHSLNKVLLNKMFDEKKNKIDEFINDQYTPAFVKNIVSQIPSSNVDTAAFTIIMQRALPKIEERKNSMKTALENERLKLIAKLDEDYNTYLLATSTMKSFLISAVKVEEERNKAFAYISQLSNGKVDLNKVEEELDTYVQNAGNLSANLQNAVNSMSNGIQSIINKQK